ncbi:hypothetical protein PTI98_007888 [Pleurotus ostreatus]|nr:hypothetical protein PTI98_007888 [Pleurotus ostreatus]
MPTPMLSAVMLLSSFLSLVGATENAALRNVTIDDRFGDAMTHVVPSYIPPNKWSPNGGSARPNASLAHNGTWHDATYHPKNAPHKASFSFTGVSLYVYCIIANTPPPHSDTFDAFANYTFFLDEELVGTYTHKAEKTHDFFYNVAVYVNQTMTNGSHNFSIAAYSQDQPVLLLFDYAVYTTIEESLDSATVSSQKAKALHTSAETVENPQPSSHTTGVLYTSTNTPDVKNGPKSHPNVGVIIHGTLGGIAFAFCIGIFFVIRVRRRQQQQTKKTSGRQLSNYRNEKAIAITHNDEGTIRELRQIIQHLRAEKRVMRAAMLPPRAPQ